MIRQHDINWFLEDPTRLLMMKPFTRGGHMNMPFFAGNDEILNNNLIQASFANLTLHPVSQDLFITEYNPTLHHIILNQSIPHIKVVMDGREIPRGEIELTHTASFQKLIHSAHVRNLTANQMEFTLCNEEPEDGEKKLFNNIKQEWVWRCRDVDKARAVNICKQVGNCALLFSFDKENNEYNVTAYSYEDGYQVIRNYDEYGIEVARTLAYQRDSKIVMDTFTNRTHYHIEQDATTERGWRIQDDIHGFSRNPLLEQRGKVAWEYAESSIEMWELMTNINIIALKRFGTFALAFWGELDKDKGIQRDSSTLVVNLSADTSNGKQDVKVLEFPEPQTMDAFLKTLEEKISLFSSTSFITPKDITTSNSGGNGIALAMSNDYALAVQSVMDWKRFSNEMVYLHQEGLALENNDNKYNQVKIAAAMLPWSLETNYTKLINLAMEAPYLSTRTLVERCPDASPDEVDRIVEERGKLISRKEADAEASATEAAKIAENESNIIRDNQ